jgi:hypothetical protein
MMKKLLTLVFIAFILNIAFTQSFWERANGPNGLNVSKLYYSPQGEVYARDFNDRTFRSLDNGLSWQEIFGPEPGIDIRNLRVGFIAPCIFKGTKGVSLLHFEHEKAIKFSFV